MILKKIIIRQRKESSQVRRKLRRSLSDLRRRILMKNFDGVACTLEPRVTIYNLFHCSIVLIALSLKSNNGEINIYI